MQTIKETISANIAKYRKKENLSQKDLATKLMTKPSTVSSWEQGVSTPNAEMIVEMCKLFHLSVDEMYGISLTDIKNEQLREELQQMSLIESYFKSLGFSIEYQVTKWHHGEIIEEPNIREQIVDDAVYILTKGEYSATFTVEEFEKLQADAKEVIEGVFYKKVMQQQSIK